MVSTSRYYPRGYIGSEQAGVLLAKLRSPDHWRSETMVPGEEEIWNGLGFTRNAEVIHYLLYSLKHQIARTDLDVDFSLTWHRYVDFDCAMQELRRALHVGQLSAEFCDERGRFDIVQKEGWGGDSGLDILLRGVVDLDDDYTRLILLSRSAISELAQSLKAEISELDEAKSKEARSLVSSPQARRPSLRRAKQIFQAWRNEFPAGGGLPTYAEDVAQMKKFNIGREVVRQFRKDFPTRSTGSRRPPPRDTEC